MADTFEIEIATPERLLVRADAIRAQIPAKEGYIGVLPDHAALLSEMGIGALTYTLPGDQVHSVAVKSGYLEILDNHVRVLTDMGELGHEIDVNKAQQELERAQNDMGNPGIDLDPANALANALHAQARIDAARKTAEKRE